MRRIPSRWLRGRTAGTGALVLLALAAGVSAVTAQTLGQVVPGALRVLGLESTVTEHLFAVSGRTLREVALRLRFVGPLGPNAERAHGLTSFALLQWWLPVRTPEGCVSHGVRVEATVRIHLPLWTGLDEAPMDQQVRWREFEERLRDHEYAHRDLTLQAATALALSIRGAHASTCPRLVRRVAHLVRQARTALMAGHVTLDNANRRRP